MAKKKRKGRALFLLLLLLIGGYLGVASREGFYPFRRPEPEPEPETEPTLEERLAEYVNGLADVSPEMKQALIAQGVGIPDVRILARPGKYDVECGKEGAPHGECQIYFDLAGVSPELVYLTTRDILVSDDPEAPFSYPEAGEGTYRSNVCLVETKEDGGYAAAAWMKDADCSYVISDGGTYQAKAMVSAEYGYARIVPEVLCVLYDEAQDAFRIVRVPFEEIEWDCIPVVHFYPEGSPMGPWAQATGYPEGENEDPDTHTFPADSRLCRNQIGCSADTYLCLWCHQWHCCDHICEKQRAYAFWCAEQTGNFDEEYYEKEYAYFVEGPGADDYRSWQTEFRARGINRDFMG